MSHLSFETRHNQNISPGQGLDHDTERRSLGEQAAEAKPASMTANAHVHAQAQVRVQVQAHTLAHSNAYACQAATAAQQQQQQTSETASLINEFGLIAEAVKRAEMAIMMRDMEGVELA